VIDLRLWRAALLIVPVAGLIAMFSLQQDPEPLQPSLSPDAFDGEAATTLAKDLAEAQPGPAPGSEQDAAISDIVEARFGAIPGAELSEQRFQTEVDGDDVELRNLILVLPGRTERQVALLAGRDSAGPGAASGIASTAALLEIAAALGGSTHDKTLVLVSTDGASSGALGARRFVRDYSEASLLDAAIVLSQPAAAQPAPPLVIPWSSGPESTGIQLERTASAIVSDEVGQPTGDEGPLRDLFRLAIPSALGEQGPLIEAGLDAVRLSSDGELPLPSAEDDADDVSGDTLDRYGRAALALVLALDEAPGPLEHGPSAYVGLAGNLLPGWTLALLGLSLLAPVAIVAGAGLASGAGSPGEAARALGWSALRAVPFVFGAAAVYVFATVGMIPSPDFPFDPAAESLGLSGSIAVGVAILLIVAVAFLLRPLLPPSTSLERSAPAAALGLAALSGFGVWLVNPYLGLVVAVGLQALVPAAAGAGPRGRLGAAGLVALGLLPALALLIDLGARFDAGLDVVWDLLFMFTGEQLSDVLAPLACLLAGSSLAIIAASGAGSAPDSEQLRLGALVERGRALEQRRAAGKQRRRKKSDRRERRREREERQRDREGKPDEDEAVSDEPEAPPSEQSDETQSEPARDPRMWSKPDAGTARPWASMIVTPKPSIT
jgi:hypothetical protein